MRKPSFFQRLTGAISPDDYDDLFEGGGQRTRRDMHGRAPRASALQHEDHDEYEYDDAPPHKHNLSPTPQPTQNDYRDDEMDDWQQQPAPAPIQQEEEQEGELAVDVYQTGDAIVVKALVAGVNPSNLDISLTRDMIVIRGSRSEHTEASEENYFYKELFWGSFTRTILLPEEVDVDEAEATTEHGILVIRLPKINKERKTKLKVRMR